MSIEWTPDERASVEAALARHPVESGRCAALARIVHQVAVPRDPDTHGIMVRPSGAARFVVPKHVPRPLWASHTLVGTMEHRVDGLTGADGTPADSYLAEHWEYPEFLRVSRVDVFAVDPGIQDAP